MPQTGSFEVVAAAVIVAVLAALLVLAIPRVLRNR
jgi:hypothetical protein